MYYGEHSIRFYPDESFVGGFTYDDPLNPPYCPDTWERWHLIPTGKVIFSPPEVEDSMLKIPGRNGLINVNKYTIGKPVYGARTGDIEFILDPDYLEDWPAIYSDIMRYFHGKERCAVLKDDRYFYYKGFFSVSDLTPGENWDTIKLSYQLDPFKYERWASDESWLWDDFDFRQGTIREYWAIELSGTAGQTISYGVEAIHPFGQDVVPKFKAYNRQHIEGGEGGNIKQFSATVNRFPIKWDVTHITGSQNFSSARVEWVNATGLPTTHSDTADANWVSVLRVMLDPEGDYHLIATLETKANALTTMNTDLAVKMESALACFNTLHDIVKDTYSAGSQELALQISDMEALLPSVAQHLYTIRDTAWSGAVQVRANDGSWKNIFSYDFVQYPEVSLNREDEWVEINEYESGNTNHELMHLYFRLTDSSNAIGIDPEITISIRGNTL